MSRARVIRLVVWKEFLDLIRDRRTIITALVLPLVSFPVIFGVMGYFANPTSNPSPILIVDFDKSTVSVNLTSILKRSPGISVTLNSASNFTKLVQSGQYDAAIVIPANFASSLRGGGQVNLTLYFDPANNRALQGISIIRGVVTDLSQQIASRRLENKGVTRADLNPIVLEQSAVGKVSNQALFLTADLFPSFLLYFTFLGGFYFIVDDIAGEKERRSLEALFTLRPSRATFFFGKFTVAFLLSLITACLGLVGTVISLENLSSLGSVILPLQILPSILAVTALAALSLSALGFCISAFAKNIREAQQYSSPIFFVVFIPLFIGSFLPPSQISQYASLPVLGYSLLIRDVIIGEITARELLLSVSVNLAVLAFLIWLSIRLLNSEKVFLRT